MSKCNNVTSGKFLKRKSRAEKSQSGSHVTTIIMDFILISLTSSITPHPAGLPLGAAVPSLLRTRLLTHLSPYTLVSLHTRLTVMSLHQPEEHSVGIYLRSSTYWGVILNRCSTWQGSWAVGWTQLTLLPCVVVSLVSSQPE